MVIRELKYDDLESLLELFTQSMTHAFLDEGLVSLRDDIINEILKKYQSAHKYLNEHDKCKIFLIAIINNEVVGSIEYRDLDKEITDNIKVNEDIKELGTIYIKPNYQGKRVASSLISEMIKRLIQQGIDQFIIECGFKTAQKVWLHKFGKPYKIVKDYWSSGSDHYIWWVKNIKRYIH